MDGGDDRGVAEPGPFPLRGLVELVLGAAGDAWRISDDGQWCSLTPLDYRMPVQGWKLHVSATPTSAPLVLHRAAGVLVRHGCAFKFAATLDRVGEMTSARTDRAQAGKFITAYPKDDDHFRELAPLLDAATAGIAGPAVLSDRPWREGSLVHYRYGAFEGVPMLTNDGLFQVRIRHPDGTAVKDVRNPWFCPPRWARLPVPGPTGRPSTAPDEPMPVLLNGRYAVREAVRHAARGGVFRATDQHTGRQVIIKQARPHISGIVAGGDARDGLRREADLLTELDGIAPQLIELFSRSGHLFLVETLVDGQPLAEWITEQLEGSPGDHECVPLDEAVRIAGKLVDLVDAVHARGLVFRDLTPSNIVVTRDGDLTLIDPELAVRSGEWAANGYTVGFAAPEQRNGPAFGPACDATVDYFALGAVLFAVASGMLSPLFPDEPPARSHQERMECILASASSHNPTARAFGPAIRG